MDRRKRNRRVAGPAGSLLVVTALLAGACAHHGPSADAEARFAAAVRDAEVAMEGEIYPALRAVSADDESLIWKGEPGASPLLVLTWTGWDGYDDLVGGKMDLSRPIWGTLAPELQEFCRHYHPHRKRALIYRLEQLLGLPPDDGKNRFVELWVEPEDLLRPCPDKEITDRKCSLGFPASESADSEYRRWFEELQGSSYGDDGYPWTRLGYTYDWGNRISPVGLSEYLVWTGATVEVRSVSKLSRYCRP